jgi:hypothetical protein
MRDAHLFRMALGIDAPWVVTRSDLDAAASAVARLRFNVAASRKAMREPEFQILPPTLRA